MEWFRLYDDIINDPKILRLDETLRWRYISLLCIVSKNSERGYLPEDEDVCLMMRIDAVEWASTKLKLTDRGLIDQNDGKFFVNGWFKRQYSRPVADEWSKIRTRIFNRDSFTCQYCGATNTRLECDHVVPVSRGGSSLDDNLVTACFKCNRSKRDKTVDEWRS